MAATQAPITPQVSDGAPVHYTLTKDAVVPRSWATTLPRHRFNLAKESVGSATGLAQCVLVRTTISGKPAKREAAAIAGEIPLADRAHYAGHRSAVVNRLNPGYRVIAHDRRGHDRSSQTGAGRSDSKGD
jgi:pimeloyl-ACP methyl ester carboxylesterase